MSPDGGSEVVVFYSGHGVPGVPDGDERPRGYLLPSDARPEDAARDGYPIDLLYDNLAKLWEADTVVVYLDACFSGVSGDGQPLLDASSVYVEAALPAGDRVTVLTASTAKQVASWDREQRHGLFTHHLLDALYGRGDGDGDGRVTVEEVSDYLDRHMTRAAMRMFDRRQRATVLGPVGVVLARAVDGTFPERPAVRVEGAEPERSARAPAARTPRNDVQRDLMLLGMKEANQAGDHEKVLDYAAKLRDLGGVVPVEAGYWQVEAYLHLRRYEEAAELLTDYLEETGRDGEHYETALRQLLRLNERLAADDEAYDRARQGGTAAAYGDYLGTHPDGRHAEEARRLKAEAEAREDDAAYRRAQAADTAAAYGEYLRKHPSGRHAAEARRQRAEAQAREDDAAYARAQATDTAAAYAAYLRRYPAGRHAAEARQRQRELERKRPGQVFRDCDRCPELVVVPAGSYLMGSPSSEEKRQADEGPRHRVTIGEPFAVGKYEVTFAQWDACARAGGCGGYRPDDRGWGRGDRPVIDVSWEDAQAYVRWLSNETGQEYRLLSESEWEYAARAGTTTPFHTGRTISTEQANYNGNSTYGAGRKGRYRQRTVPVGSFGANAFGLHDVHGNLREWTQDCRNDSYQGAPADGSAWERGECDRRVVRGGSWGDDARDLRSANRYWNSTGDRSDSSGFRVARTLTS